MPIHRPQNPRAHKCTFKIFKVKLGESPHGHGLWVTRSPILRNILVRKNRFKVLEPKFQVKIMAIRRGRQPKITQTQCFRFIKTTSDKA